MHESDKDRTRVVTGVCVVTRKEERTFFLSRGKREAGEERWGLEESVAGALTKGVG